jgi:archaellum component FlaF (FlaF/FlaG flagellin family)
MGASVGIGALVIGTSLLLVFGIAIQTLDDRLDASLEIIDEAADAAPEIRIDDATLWEGAVLSVTVASNGSGYQNGTLTTSGGTGGFLGGFTVDASGGIETVYITIRGNYSSAPTVIVDPTGQPGAASGATFTVDIGNFIYANMTNVGSTTVGLADGWIFLDGSSGPAPTNLASAYTPSINSTNWYPGETIAMEWPEDGASSYERIALTVLGQTVGLPLA